MSHNLYSPETIAKIQNLRYGDEALHNWANTVHEAQRAAEESWSTAVKKVAEKWGLNPRWSAPRRRESIPQIGEWESPHYDNCEVVEVIGQPSFDCARFSIVYRRPAAPEVNWPEVHFIEHFELVDTSEQAAFRTMVRKLLAEASDIVYRDGFSFRKGDLSGNAVGASKRR